MPKKILFIDPLKCTGCLRCELACSYIKGKVFNLTISRIRLLRFKEKELFYPATCEQCSNPPCKLACPVDAISINEKNGAVIIDEELCIGCHQCFTACPIGRVSLVPNVQIPLICDLCEGEPVPVCVLECDYDALKFINFDLANNEVKKKRIELTSKILELIG